MGRGTHKHNDMKKTIIIALIVILLLLALLSYRKNHEEETFDRMVREIAGIEKVEETKETEEPISETQENNISEDSQEGGNMRVNFEKLKELNPDIIGWIYASGTRINYPVVSSPQEPDFYLRRDLYGKYNSHGSIYTRKEDFPGRAAIIYGHNMRDKTMFGTVDRYFDDGLTSGIEIFLPWETRTYHFHSAYVEEPFDLEDRFKGLSSESDTEEYLSYVSERSGKDIASGSSIITLSTCTPDGKQRLIVNFTYDA